MKSAILPTLLKLLPDRRIAAVACKLLLNMPFTSLDEANLKVCPALHYVFTTSVVPTK